MTNVLVLNDTSTTPIPTSINHHNNNNTASSSIIIGNSRNKNINMEYDQI